jgi:CheY-like chemotaxis protein
MNRATVLIVDDDANDVLLFQHACDRAGVTLRLQVAEDGEQAIAYLSGAGKFGDRDQYPLPHLVLLDLKMPRVNGFEVLDWMRHDEKFRRLPAVILTSSNYETDVKRAYDSGANSYLVKPVGFEALVELTKAIHHYWLTLNERPDFL